MSNHFNIRDINAGFRKIIKEVDTRIQEEFLVEETTRNGKVWSFEDPVLITYHNPVHKVLFNDARDCNPFFHLYEAMWMLHGSNDVTQLTPFNSRMAEFSDDGTKLHGAYGYRWKHLFNVDQLATVINELRCNPTTRRAVVAMWSPYNDLMKITHGKDVPCNTQIFFRVVDNQLNMTVTNRSNDLIWGCLGANYVHFSFLLEYVATCAGYEVGKYHQFSNNLHVYEWNWKPTEWIQGRSPFYYHGPDIKENITTCLMKSDGATKNALDYDIRLCVENPRRSMGEYRTSFGKDLLGPVFELWRHYKAGGFGDARMYYENLPSYLRYDWLEAGFLWIKRRETRKRVKAIKASEDIDFRKEDPHVNCNNDVD